MHHILDPRTGLPAVTDAVGATVVCEKSIDAEGFSTTALALGVEGGLAFCKAQPEIISAFLLTYRETAAHCTVARKRDAPAMNCTFGV